MRRNIAAIVRHGEYEQPESTPSAHLPHPLTSRGIAQVRSAAEEITTEAERRGWT